MRIYVYEDRHVRGLEPLTLTRPAADLLCGLTTLGQKYARYFAASTVGHFCRPAVAELIRSRAPDAGVNDSCWLRSGPTIVVNARWVPPSAKSAANPLADGPYLGTAGGLVAFAVLDTARLPEVSPAMLEDGLDGAMTDALRALPRREVGGRLVERPWELIDLNAEQITRDFEADADPTAAGFYPAGFALVGPADRLFIHPAARIDPMVVADTTHGPVFIDSGAVVHSFTRLEGPCAVGAGSVVLGATVRAGTTIGPHCRIGGEVECSILLGYANKYHGGFLGHSYVGEWVNLAAGTHTSDLRCDYHPVSVPINGREVPTGRTKVGSIIGDHAKTGLGVLLNCGTVIGPFAQVLPTGVFAPREIPAFARVGPSGVKGLEDVDRLLATAGTVMCRRGRELTPALETLYRSLAAGRSEGATVLPMRRSA
jgi:UDP-N-acetylglucosamine diphosphorylase/glucosamine-1-phosphate N-acetyltransferase